MQTPNAPATEKQIDYINELIRKARGQYTQKRLSLADVKDADPTGPARHERRAYDAAALLEQLWNAVVIPTDLTQKRASAWIDQLQKMPAETAMLWLDKPAVAQSFGVAAFVEANRQAIEKAL